MDIRLPTRLEEFVRAKVKSGDYADPSEVIGDALRLLERRDEVYREKLEALRAAIDKGAASGIAEDFSFEKLNAELDAELDGAIGTTR